MSQLSYTADHRIHNLNVSLGACSKNRSQLSLKNILIPKAKTNRSEAHKRIIFLRATIPQSLIATDIQGADNHGLISSSSYNSRIFIILYRFRRIAMMSKEDPFGAE